MKLIPVKCPSCGATISANDGGETIVCDYCKTESAVQRRAGMLERPVELAAKDRELPVATQTHSWQWGLVIVLIPFLALSVPIGGALYFAFAIRWTGTEQPIAIDVDGDGLADAIGLVQRGGESVKIGAFDGPTGSKLWSTETIGDYSDVISGMLGVVDETVLYFSESGEVSAFDAKSGSGKWTKGSLGEKVSRLCVGEGGSAIAELADGSRRRIDLGSGSVQQAPAAECRRAWTDTRDFPADVEVKDNLHITVGGVRVDEGLKKEGRPWVVLGSKAKGTSVPMVAGVGPEVSDALLEGSDSIPAAWETPIPAVDALEVHGILPPPALSNDSVFAIYELDDRLPRLTAISLRDGSRMWDVEIDRDAPATGVAHGTGRVFVALWGTLLVYDAGTGTELYRVGL